MSETNPPSDLADGEPTNGDSGPLARPAKVSRWDRPKPPHDWRWFVGGVGRALITLGLLMFGFVAYQLWGTGIQTAQAQRSLSKDFDRQVAAIGTGTTTTTTTTTTEPSTSTTEPQSTTTTALPTTTTSTLPGGQPVPAQGEALARLEIPRIKLNRIVVEGATADDLTKGPGHFPETPLPGQLGNSAIAGHRTTYLHPFYDIDRLEPGDEIVVTTLNGRYVYHVAGTVIVTPDDYAAVIPTQDPSKATLTLVSCTPRYSSSKRIVVRADLVVDQSDPLTAAAPAAASGAGTLPGDSVPVDTVPAETVPAQTSIAIIDDTTIPERTTTTTTIPAAVAPSAPPPEAFTDGWFSDKAGIPHALLWGALLAAIGYGVLWLSRKVRRYWVGILAGIAPFLVALYFFYENVNRLLPPNL
ncbi:MAG TPA: class E sortase [Ilumatobacteraceae bacterium]